MHGTKQFIDVDGLVDAMFDAIVFHNFGVEVDGAGQIAFRVGDFRGLAKK